MSFRHVHFMLRQGITVIDLLCAFTEESKLRTQYFKFSELLIDHVLIRDIQAGGVYDPDRCDVRALTDLCLASGRLHDQLMLICNLSGYQEPLRVRKRPAVIHFF